MRNVPDHSVKVVDPSSITIVEEKLILEEVNVITGYKAMINVYMNHGISPRVYFCTLNPNKSFFGNNKLCVLTICVLYRLIKKYKTFLLLQTIPRNGYYEMCNLFAFLYPNSFFPSPSLQEELQYPAERVTFEYCGFF